MGAWGVLPFENDAAMDWVAQLQSAGLSALQVALQSPAESTYLDLDDASAAVGAAAIVASARGGYRGELPSEVQDWLHEHRDQVGVDMIARARMGLDGVARSELQELWEESGELDAWMKTIDDIRYGLEV